MKRILAVFTSICLASCSTQQDLATVSNVDIAKYMGKWYEIASFPQRFQKGCSCTVAEYSLKGNGTVKVDNSCNVDGEKKQSIGTAKVVDKNTNAKLKVSFFWPFWGKYWIIDLADDYSYAVVGHPNREYLWILSRSADMNTELYDKIVARAKAKGFDITMLQKTVQSETCR